MNFKLKKSDLNFNVYTTETVPTAPGVNNDIAIITPVPMSNWILSPDEPSGVPRSDGDVWIRYSVSGNTFNALKQNTMRIAMLYAKQYVSGAWVNVTAKSYQGGEWVEWITDLYLYNAGDLCTNVTGGWEIFQCDPGCATSLSYGTNSYGKLTVQLPGSKNTCAAYGTKKSIDLTDYTTIQFIVTDIYDGECMFGVCKTRDTSVEDNSTVVKTVNDSGIVELNVSSLYGAYYVWFGDYTYTTAGKYGASVSAIQMLR